jgi:cytochrome c oxidase cbb3-type subunit IV
MDTNTLRAAVTLAGLCLFVLLVLWAWSPRRRSAHVAAAQLPFAGDDTPASAAPTTKGNAP